ncbi:constitutive coactivator of peroxisome proliferator-activated receptor gamma isoform X2 [Sphaeramia orbicularis]|uniref:constitutive coactivator of peroxisome proliferator-activated receptor gamma isoform X2 n=1 Tax=Sphaeramia orbicularis TaxID=375764 RepID=UPI00117D784C|nr:constitutive coactivator of peroxisome proliferator-activated receptor gamma isoform X2 [Sphaeramia orbicularis]
MGVKGLQSFLEHCCPQACVNVNLREMVRQHAGCTHTSSPTSPTLVVDGMACLRHWYTCKDWVSGGQWKEYMDILMNWVQAFTSAGIRLVFFFDGVVEEKKRPSWVKRRRRVNGDVSKIFNHIKARGDQPGRELFGFPPGLATFTSFALRSLGQEVFLSVMEADYEISSYAREHGCMGILGQDTDFIIYDSAPYLSVSKLRIENLTTVLYDRQAFCRAIGLAVYQLPLLACFLGNDVVPEQRMQHMRNIAMTTYRQSSPTPQSDVPHGQILSAVSQFVSSLWSREDENNLIPLSLKLSPSDRELIERGVYSYLLTEQEAHQECDITTPPSGAVFEKYVSPEVLKACREKHVAAQGFMVYCVVSEGVVDCSNSLEDAEDTELLPQALVYKRCRQHIYGLLLLLHGPDGSTVDPPAVKEWFVYPGNSLNEPDLVHPIPLNLQCDHLSLDLLWFGSGPEVSSLRLASFLSIFDCQDFSELYGVVEEHLLAALCLITYIVLQVQTLSQEDVDAYLSQAVCVALKSPQELQQIKLPFLCSRAVQLGSLYVRGLSHLLGANCASGCPLPSAALMPWHSFDGRLFHSKYLLAHSGAEQTVLLDGDSSCVTLFLRLREKLTEACCKSGRVLQSRPRPNTAQQRHRTTPGPRYRDRHTGGTSGWRDRGERGYHHHGRGWRGASRGRQNEYEGEGLWERGWGRHNIAPQQPDFYPHYHHGGGVQNINRPQNQPRGRFDQSRGRYQLAPRWSQPPAS